MADATLVSADITASNGVIHVIDQVLIPKARLNKPLTPSQLIELAIERGVPIFNKGDVDGCAVVYEVTVQALRGMEGVPNVSQKVFSQALAEAAAANSSRDRAWILRKALDTTWESINHLH